MLSETFYLLKINITFIEISDQFLLSRYSFVTHSSCCRTCSPHGIAFIKQQILHRRIIHNVCKAIRRISMLIMRLKGYIYNVFFFCLLAVSESDLVFALVQSPAVLCCSLGDLRRKYIFFQYFLLLLLFFNLRYLKNCLCFRLISPVKCKTHSILHVIVYLVIQKKSEFY